MILLIAILLVYGSLGVIFTYVKYLREVTLVLLALPIAPFIIAGRIKKEKPAMSKILMGLWCLVYLVIAFNLFLYWKTA